MTITELKKHALSSLKGNWGKAIFVMFIATLLGYIPTLIEINFAGGIDEYQKFLEDPDRFSPPFVYVFEVIAGILLVPITVGISWFYLDISRGTNTEVTDILDPYKKFLKMVGASIVMGVFIVLWSLLLIIPGIIKSISYSQTFYILKDHPDMGILEAITESKNRMKGYKGQYFLTYLSFIGWILLSIAITFPFYLSDSYFGMFAIDVAFLFVYPYLFTTIGAFYQFLIAKDVQ